MVQSRQLNVYVCGFGTCQRVSNRSMQMAGQLQGMASAGSVKGARGILARGCAGSAANACLAGFYFERFEKWDRAAVPFWVRFGNLSFSEIVFFGSLVFGAAWRPLFSSRLATSQLSVLFLAGAAAMNETSSSYIFLVRRVQRCDLALISL